MRVESCRDERLQIEFVGMFAPRACGRPGKESIGVMRGSEGVLTLGQMGEVFDGRRLELVLEEERQPVHSDATIGT